LEVSIQPRKRRGEGSPHVRTSGTVAKKDYFRTEGAGRIILALLPKRNYLDA